METALVSIIMPMYNAGKFLSKSIESVLEQTYQNWELLLIDDGSKDDSIDIALAFMEKDSRIFLLKNEQNMGIAKTRNKGIEASKGQYIAFLDSDDLWLPNKLEVQIKWMEEKNFYLHVVLILYVMKGAKLLMSVILVRDHKAIKIF